MKTETEILEKRNQLAIYILKTRYDFIYSQMILEAREMLENWVKDSAQDELTDLATDGVNTEYFDGHHSSTSSSVDFDEVKEVMSAYDSEMGLIAKIYENS